MTRHLRTTIIWLQWRRIWAAVLMICTVGELSALAADLPQLRMDRFSLENRLANFPGKHPFLTNTGALHDLRQAEKIALTYPDVRSRYQGARDQVYALMLPAFPDLNVMATARPPLEDESLRIKAAGTSDEQESQQRSLQLRLEAFATNSFYVSDWCQLDMLMLGSCIDAKTSTALREARRAALFQITNGAPPDLISTALAASQVELEAADAILRLQELNRAISKVANSKADLAPSDTAQLAFTRLQAAKSSVPLDERLVLFPATELLASTAGDVLPAVSVYLNRWESHTNAVAAQEKASTKTNVWSTGAGNVFRSRAVWSALGLLVILCVGWALFKKLAPLLQRRPEPVVKKKVYSDVLGEDVPDDEPKAAPPPPAKTAKECFAQGFVGTGMEMLERAVKDNPKNFERRMELANAHYHHCHNPRRAVQILRELLESSDCTPEQEEQVRELLKKWE